MLPRRAASLCPISMMEAFLAEMLSFCASSCCDFTFASTGFRATLSLLYIVFRATLSLCCVIFRALFCLTLLAISLGTGSSWAAIAIMVGLVEAMAFEDNTSGEEYTTDL